VVSEESPQADGVDGGRDAPAMLPIVQTT